MAYILFVDESGQDRHESPYEVLGGIAVKDSAVWALISSIQDAEHAYFGGRVSKDEMELKAKKLLKTKTFKLAQQLPAIESTERTRLAREALEEGRLAKAEGREAKHTKKQLTALAQAKIEFCQKVLNLCAQHQAKAFASIIPQAAPRPSLQGLRKDYSYLFERFFYFLAETDKSEHGIVVFDELERSQSHILIHQMSEYFKKTVKGRQRASRILPEPMFVHSDLTSLIQVADLIVYMVAWGVRIKGMSAPMRPELAGLADDVKYLRFHTVIQDQDTSDKKYELWSFVLISDLRPAIEKGEIEAPQKGKRQ